MKAERGLHQEISVGRKAGPGIIQVSYYFDSLDRVMTSGGGALTSADIESVSEAAHRRDSRRCHRRELPHARRQLQDPRGECR